MTCLSKVYEQGNKEYALFSKKKGNKITVPYSFHPYFTALCIFPLIGLVISLQLLRGEIEQVRRENPVVFNRGVAITRKVGFPDVIMPGETMTIYAEQFNQR